MTTPSDTPGAPAGGPSAPSGSAPGGSAPGGPGSQPPPEAGDEYHGSSKTSKQIASRLGGVLRALISVHVEIAQEEAEKELRRAIVLGTLFGGAAVFSFVSLLTACLLVVLGIQRLTGLPWLESVAIGLGVFFGIVILLMLTATLALRRPFMPRTRALIKRTVDSIKGEDERKRPLR